MPPKKPELVFGLVGPVGTDLTILANVLAEALLSVGYESETYRLSHLMHDLDVPPWSELRSGNYDDEVQQHMDAGNALRQKLGNDAVALLGLAAIRAVREKKNGDQNQSIPAYAHILQSLKRPEEVDTLRRVYGPTFFLLGAYSTHRKRVQYLSERIAKSRHSNKYAEFTPRAQSIVDRDEQEIGVESGQNVRGTFPLADVIVNTDDARATKESINRFVELLFGNSFHTPTRDEEGMYHAHASAFRSASLARQVGAAICRKDGSIIATGTNEVPRPGGGAYWEDSDADGRDFRKGYDSSDQMRENLLADILNRLFDNAWLDPQKTKDALDALIKEHNKKGCFLHGAQFASTIDFVRAVHAEAAAITTAARHGIATSGSILYTTTFPCHDCAKHIVATGIMRVVYVEPYPKSLVNELFADSIAVDPEDDCTNKVRFEPFVGITPKRYGDMFALGSRRRKNSDGTVVQWRPSEAVPNLPGYLPSATTRLSLEMEETSRFKDALKDKGIIPRE